MKHWMDVEQEKKKGGRVGVILWLSGRQASIHVYKYAVKIKYLFELSLILSLFTKIRIIKYNVHNWSWSNMI